MGESVPLPANIEEALPQSSGARWFWALLAARIAHDSDMTRRLAAGEEAAWQRMRIELEKIQAALSQIAIDNRLATLAAEGRGDDRELVERAADILRDKLVRDGLSALDDLRINSSRVPESIKPAYWDGLTDWARQQVEERGGRYGEVILRGLTPPELNLLANSLRGIETVKRYALGPWMQASAQQGLLNLRGALSRGEFVYDPRRSAYPVTDISTADVKAHAEIRPTDFEKGRAGESELQQAMRLMAESLRRRGVIVADVSDALLYLWSRKRGPDGWAHVTLDDVCEVLGRTPRAGRKGGYEPRARDAVREAVEKVTHVLMTVRHIEKGADGKPHRMQNGAVIGITDPVVMIRNYVPVRGEPVQTELWGPTKWDSVYIQPGAYARHAIERNGAEFLIRSRKLFALDDYRHRAVKLLGQSLENLFRINARTGPAIRLRVSTLLGYADIGDEDPRPEDREALEAALDKLVEIEVLRGWQYGNGFAVDGKVRQRLTARRLEEWRASTVEIEAAHAVAEQYAPIAQRALVYADKARQRTERAARKAEQAKAPPAGMGAELRALRTRIGASVLVAGERIGISAASVSRIENGARVSEQVAAKVRAWLKTAG